MKRGDNSKRLLTLFSGYTITASQVTKETKSVRHIIIYLLLISAVIWSITSSVKLVLHAQSENAENLKIKPNDL